VLLGRANRIVQPMKELGEPLVRDVPRKGVAAAGFRREQIIGESEKQRPRKEC
jgi:hypothetical protein